METATNHPDPPINAWIEHRSAGCQWFVRGCLDGHEMDLEGWAPDPQSAVVLATKEQVRWLMKQGLGVNRYVVPEPPAAQDS